MHRSKSGPAQSELVKLRPQGQSPYKTIAALIRSAWSSTPHNLCIDLHRSGCEYANHLTM